MLERFLRIIVELEQVSKHDVKKTVTSEGLLFCWERPAQELSRAKQKINSKLNLSRAAIKQLTSILVCVCVCVRGASHFSLFTLFC